MLSIKRPRMSKKTIENFKSTAVKIFFTAFFVLFCAVLTAPFLAETKLLAAQGLMNKYLWQDALRNFKTAMAIDPLDARYPAGFADFLNNISPGRADENYLLTNSIKLYERALELDPFNAGYALRLGETELALFTRSNKTDVNALRKALHYFKLALENDPNGFNISYSVGYEGLSVWDSLTVPEKELISGRLKYTLESKPWYSEHIFSRLLQSTKDSGVICRIRPRESDQEKREKLKRMEKIKQGNTGQSWQGKSKDGSNVYVNGNMYWSGTIDRLLNFPAGQAVVKIRAKGSPASDVWPYMIVELDGEEIGETFVNNSEWEEYSFPVNTNPGPKVLSVTFLNDGGNAQKNEDRNLYIGEVEVIKNE